MKLYALTILQAKPQEEATVLVNAQDLSSFSFYQRGTVGEFLPFFARTIVDRTDPGQRQSVAESNYVFHVYNRGGDEQLAGELSMSCSIGSWMANQSHFYKLFSLQIPSIPRDQLLACSLKSLRHLSLKFLNHTMPTQRLSISPTLKAFSSNTKIHRRQTILCDSNKSWMTQRSFFTKPLTPCWHVGRGLIT